MAYGLHLDSRDVHQSVNNGVDSESRRAVNLQLAGDITAVSDDSVDGYAEMVSYFLVRHALHKSNDDVLLTIGQSL